VNRPSGFVSEMHERSRYPDFSESVATLKARPGLVWAWPDVEKWAKATGRTVQMVRTSRPAEFARSLDPRSWSS
jgi:hypothetical protein